MSDGDAADERSGGARSPLIAGSSGSPISSMAICPKCQRPIAVARAQCLYCGAVLEPSLVPALAAEPPAVPADDRALVLIDGQGADPEILSRALGVSALEAERRMHRGWQLHRIATPVEAEAEAARLRETGLRAMTVAAADMRPASQPTLAAGGRRLEGGLELRTDRGVVPVRTQDVLLIVAGHIHRERQSVQPKRGHMPSPLYPGFRFHIHLHADPCPIEIDPAAFAFDEPTGVPTSSMLELRSWLDALADPGIMDDGFRFVPPALGVAAPSTPGDLTRALRDRPPRDDRPATLDNLAQFRFYSGWRAGALRRAARG